MEIHFKNIEEWRKWRADNRVIGASYVPAILGKSHFATPLDVYNQLQGIQVVEENDAMTFGHDFENAIALNFARQTGFQIVESSIDDFMLIDDAHPWRGCSPDRFCIDDLKELSNAQIKTSGRVVDENNIDPYYLLQVQYEMGIERACGYNVNKTYLVWLDPVAFRAKKVKFTIIYFDEELFEKECVAVDLMHESIDSNTPPVPVIANDVKHIAVNKEKAPVIASIDTLKEINRYNDLTQEIKDAEAEQGEIKDRLSVLFGDCDTMTFNGEIVATYKQGAGRKSFDSKTFKADYPELYDRYIKLSAGYRTLLIK